MVWFDLIMLILYSFLFLSDKNKDNIRLAISYYYCIIGFSVCFSILFAWEYASQSIFMFYLCLVIVISVYIFQTFMTTKIFKNFFDKTGKKRFIIILEIAIILLSLLFCLWMVVICGMFIYDNIFTIQIDLYNVPETNNWFDFQGYFEKFVWLLTTCKELFIIGFYFLFTVSPEGHWEWFFTFNKWIYTGVIFINVINTIHNTGKICNYNHDK